jgi:hypothetical protein
MITFDAFLVFLGAAALPVFYVLALSHWIEPAYRRAYPNKAEGEPKPVVKHHLVQQAA